VAIGMKAMDNQDRNSRWLTIQEVALRLHVSRDTVERWINAGSVQAVDVSGRSKRESRRPLWRIDAASLEAFLEGRANCPPMPMPRTHRIRSSGVIEFIK
jgi:excisionase family DNA binding protein